MSQRDQLRDVLADPGSQLSAADPGVRRIAVAAAIDHPDLTERLSSMLATDPDATVRRECAEVLGRSKRGTFEMLAAACADDSAQVREAAVTALGELEATDGVSLLVEFAIEADEDKLVREAAVAALGAIGDERAIPVLLDLIASAAPQIRRRCVPALSVFDGDEVEAALRRAASDRNPMVREAAEMVVGRTAN